MKAKDIKIQPRWMTYEQASLYCGLGVRVIQNHARNGYIRFTNVCAPGATRGRVLIDVKSLDDFIEKGVGHVAKLVMNTKAIEKKSKTKTVVEKAEAIMSNANE